MMNNSGGDDCFFYYNSNCAKGSLCPFRHEPAALKTEIICTYWQQGRCTRPNCMFRHSQIVKKRTQTICHWESQASGCINPNCHFLHVTQKTQGYMAIIPQPATTKNTIIINKKKFGDLIVPTNPGATNQPDPANPETEKPVDTPSSSVMEVTSEGSPSGIKTRLGVKARLGAKSRLGPQMVPPPKSVKFFGEFEDDNEKVAVFEFSDYDSEEEHLRADAIKTIDLRNRLSTKQSDEEEDSSVQVMSSVVVPPKKSKKDKKEKKEKEKDKKKKKEKDKKKEKKEKERVTKETKRMVIAKGRKSKIDELESDAVSNETSLAIQIASKREISEQSRFRSDIKERIGRRREEVKQTRGPISKDVGNRDDDKVSKRRTEENIYNVVERDDKVSKRRPEENIYNVVERDDKLSKRKVEEHIYNVIRKRRFQESDNSANKRSRSSPDRTSCKKSTEETRCHDEESKSVSNLSPEKVSPSKEKEKSKKSVSGDLDEESNIGPNKIKKRKPENFTDHLKKTRKDLKAEAPTKNSGGKSSDVNLSVDSSFDEKGIGFNDHDVTLLESSDDEKVSTTNLSENDDIMKQLNDYINS